MTEQTPIEPEVIPTQDPNPNTQALAVRPQAGAVGVLRPADTLDAIADAFKQYQQVCERILTPDDYQEYEGRPRKKKSAWRKLATAFNVSTRVVEKEIERDDARNVLAAFFTVEASVGSRITNGSGYCEVTEKCCPTRLGHKCRKAAWKGHYCCENGCDGRKHWSHANHDVIATAETRAKNRAIADLIGCGEVSAEELTDDGAKTAPQAPAGQKPSPAPRQAPKPAPAPEQAPPRPTVVDRAKMIFELKAQPDQGNRQRVTEYFRTVGPPTPLMANEEIEALDLRFVPSTDQQRRDLAEKIARFDAGDPAEFAFPPHFDPQDPTPGVKTPAQVAPKVLAEATKKPADPLWWRNVIVSKPRKGMKKAEYERHPDTLGALYDLRHGNDEEAQAARQRLWGLAEHAPEPREYNGRTYQPTEADWTTYRAAQAFKEWFAANHPDEKL